MEAQYFEKLVSEFLTNFKQVYSLFGWWGLGIVALTFLLMLPINLGIKKLFGLIKKGDQKLIGRFRKMTSTATVFLVAMGLIALFTAFVSKADLNFSYVYQSSIPCGLLAMTMNFVYKGGRDTVLAFIAKILKSNEFKIGVNDVLKNKYLSTLVVEYLDSVELEYITAKAEEKAKKQAEILSNLKNKLMGFVDNPSIIVASIWKLFVDRIEKNQDKAA